MTTFLKTITLTTIVAGAIALAGCTAAPAPTTTDAATPAPTSTAIEAPTATDGATTPATSAPEDTGAATPVDVADLETGAELDAATAKALNAAIRTKGDDRAYELADGSYVLLKYGDPLPEEIAQAVQEDAVSQTSGINSTDSGVRGDAIDRMVAAAAAQEQATGKSFIIVTHMTSYNDATRSYEPAYGVNIGATAPFSSLGAATAFAQKWVDVAPATREILVVDTLG